MVADDPISIINKPLQAPDGTVVSPVMQRERPLHAVLVEVHTRALLQRLELGVQARPGEARELIRGIVRGHAAAAAGAERCARA
jgi:hypothetical protein